MDLDGFFPKNFREILLYLAGSWSLVRGNPTRRMLEAQQLWKRSQFWILLASFLQGNLGSEKMICAPTIGATSDLSIVWPVDMLPIPPRNPVRMVLVPITGHWFSVAQLWSIGCPIIFADPASSRWFFPVYATFSWKKVVQIISAPHQAALPEKCSHKETGIKDSAAIILPAVKLS